RCTQKVGRGTDESATLNASSVLSTGKPPCLSRMRRLAASRAAISAWSNERSTSSALQRCVMAFWSTSGACSRIVASRRRRNDSTETCGAAECLADGLPSPDRHQLNDLGELVLQPQRAGRGGGAQKRLRSGPQAQERNLGWGPRANTARGSPIGIGQVAEGHLA